MDIFIQMLKALQNRVEKLEGGAFLTKLTIPSGGYFVPKVVSTDPSSPKTNEVWINSTTSQLKWYTGSTTKVVTLS